MSDVVIEAHGLTKRYRSFTAVDSLELAINRGEVYGLLGPNGSGKTTTILMLLGLTDPTAGEVRVLGMNPARHPLSVKARVGYLPDQIGFYGRLTARENLGYIAQLNGLNVTEARQRIDEALNRMGLTDAANKPVRTYSHGMRQRLGLAELLIKRPEIIIMDEPTLGLDPEAARQFLEIVRGLKDDGITILVSSHLLYQVQAVCDRVGLFHRGRIRLEGSVPELAQRVLGGAYRIRLDAAGSGLDAPLKALPGVTAVQHDGGTQYVIEAETDVRAEAVRTVLDAGGSLKSLNLETPSLDDIYARYFEEVTHASVA